MELKNVIRGLGVAAFIGFALPAQAVPAQAVVSPCPVTGVSLTDVRYSGDGFVPVDSNGTAADDCFRDDSGNESQNRMNGLKQNGQPLDAPLGSIFGGNWTFLTKVTPPNTVDSGGTLLGYGFTMSYTGPVDNMFAFTVTPTGGNQSDLPIQIDFAFNIKQGSGFVSYFFDNALVYAGSNGGTFLVPAFMEGTNDFSHFSLYGRDARDYICEPGTPGCDHNVPEPGSLALLGAGIAGLALIRRRRRV